jgi:hypothetical protein
VRRFKYTFCFHLICCNVRILGIPCDRLSSLTDQKPPKDANDALRLKDMPNLIPDMLRAAAVQSHEKIQVFADYRNQVNDFLYFDGGTCVEVLYVVYYRYRGYIVLCGYHNCNAK